jgi:hypothetical protein
MSAKLPRPQGGRDVGRTPVRDARLLRLAADHQAAPDLTGAKVGRYTITRLLGQGAMGVVYAARDPTLGRDVALKILSADLDAPDQLVREARLLATLEHELIVPVYEVGEHEGIAYFTMKFVDGGPLQTPAPSARKAAGIALTISRAVAFCHQRGILHGDLKPQNVLVDKTGRHFVTDFGLAASEGIAAGPLELGGTPTYMAPEVWQGDASARATMADVWSIGAILYELISGRPPFLAASWDELRRSVAEAAPPPLRGSTLDLVAVCHRCLEKDPARRYPTAFELAEDLARFLRGAPVAARPLGPGARLLRTAARHPVIAALVTLLVVAALYAGIATLSLGRTQRTALHAANAMALSLARLTALQFDHYAALVVSAAGQTPLLASALSAPASPKASDFCARSLAEQDPAFSTWFLLDASGAMLGRAPAQGAHATLGQSYAFRDYFRGAEAIVTQHQRGAYVSHAYRSEGDDTYEIAISAPVIAGDRWIGVLVATLATGAALGSLQVDFPVGEDVTAALLAPRDGSRLDVDRGSEPIFILHRGLPRGEVTPVRGVGSASPDPGSRAFERIVPVGNTPFSVLIRVAFDG